MIRLGRVKDLVMIKDYPDELQAAVLEVLEILDDYHGADRDIISDNSGYVLFTESKVDFPEIDKAIHGNLGEDGIPEYVNIIRCKNKEVFTISLFILSSDYGVIVVMPYNITPKNLLRFAD